MLGVFQGLVVSGLSVVECRFLGLFLLFFLLVSG